MKLKILFIIFLTIISLPSCTIFKTVKSNESVNGTFNAFYNQREFNGFFSISKNRLRLDIVNALGFSMYGIYAQNDTVFIKNYQNGQVYKKLDVDGNDLSIYKPLILYTMKNFMSLCKNENRNIIVLSCVNIDGNTIPSSIVFTNKNSMRLRINLHNIKIKILRSTK